MTRLNLKLWILLTRVREDSTGYLRFTKVMNLKKFHQVDLLLVGIPRDKALKKANSKKNDRLIFSLEFSPQLPSVSGIMQSAWRVMTKDPHLKKVLYW